MKKVEQQSTTNVLTTIGFTNDAVASISNILNNLLADTFALYFKTKNFHWHVCGPHFRDYHLLFDEQALQLIDITDKIGERVRKIGGTTLTSINQAASLTHIKPNDDTFVPARDMLIDLLEDNMGYLRQLRDIHDICSQYRDVASCSLIENWIDDTEGRCWFLRENLVSIENIDGLSKHVSYPSLLDNKSEVHTL